MIRRGRQRASTLALSAALVAVLAAGCTLGLGEVEPPGGSVLDVLVPLIEPDEREAAPEVVGETIHEQELALADVAGTPVVVNFWASWCGPCAREIPELVEIAAEYDGQVQLIGVNVQDHRTNAASFERDQSVTYPSWFDPSATIAAAFGGIAPEALPSTLLLDAEHRVAVRLFGAVTAPQLRGYLDDILAE